MAELSQFPAHEQIFFEIFPPAYNAAHGTNYTGQPLHEEHRLWDYQWPPPDGAHPPLEVQHTAAGSDQKRERVTPKNIGQVQAEIQRRLNQHQIAGHVVTLRWIGGVPENSTVRTKLIEEIWSRIEAAFAAGVPLGASRTLHWRRRQGSGDELPTILLSRHGRGSRSGLLSSVEAWHEDRAARLRAAVEKKIYHLTRQQQLEAVRQMVLAVDFDLHGYDLDDLSEMRAALESLAVPYGEVWAVDLTEHKHAQQVWP